MISSYISNLRKKIAHDFLLLPSVTILVFDEERKVLLVRHHNNNVWVAPGGMIETDETPEDAAVREMREETGCEIELIRILGAFGGPGFRITYDNGDEVGYVMILYEARIKSGEMKADGIEILEVKYFSYDETKDLKCGKWLPVILDKVYETQ